MPATIKAGDLFTLGLGNDSLDTFARKLMRYDIRAVIDVRHTAQERYLPHFNALNLQASLQSIGIRYMHVADLSEDPTMSREEFETALHKLNNTAEQYRTCVIAKPLKLSLIHI